jgi:hypothetical protein
MSIIKWLLSSSFVQSFANREVRHLATAASGFVLSWLVAHQSNQSDAASIAQGVFAIIVGGAGYGLSRLNGSNNETKVQVAAATGAVIDDKTANGLTKQGGDPAGAAALAKLAIAHADADAPTTKAALLADLAARGPK